VHHNGPQYFGYLGDNTAEQANLHGLQDFFTAISNQSLPASGVFYVRGGYGNNDNMVPLVPNTTEQALFVGNDDHPAYSDAFISEAQVADVVNAIASSPYWSQSAIIITYDETDGLYDHAGMSVRNWDPHGLPLSGGPRIPAIVISPYSAAHTISTAYSEHSSVIKFIDELFGLVPLAKLPDEVNGRLLGAVQAATLNQPELGPADAGVEPMGDLTEAFDNDRLLGLVSPLPAEYAMTDNPQALPPYNRQGCQALGITPTDFPNGLNNPPSDPAPAEFNPRPSTAPGIPTVPGWTPQNGNLSGTVRR
jgi:phospholipase C